MCLVFLIFDVGHFQVRLKSVLYLSQFQWPNKFFIVYSWACIDIHIHIVTIVLCIVPELYLHINIEVSRGPAGSPILQYTY